MKPNDRSHFTAKASFALLPVAAALSLCGGLVSSTLAAPLAPIQAVQSVALGLQQAYPIYPIISINGAQQDTALGFFAEGDTVYANYAGLVKLGIRLTDAECQATGTSSVAGVPQGYFALSECLLLQHKYLPARQRLEIVAPLDRLDLAVTRIGFSQSGTPQLSRPNFSTVLNYDASISGGDNGNNSKGLYTQWRFGTPWGYFESNHVQNNSQGSTTHQRLDS